MESKMHMENWDILYLIQIFKREYIVCLFVLESVCPTMRVLEHIMVVGYGEQQIK